jgi:hypothetical protein
LPAWPSAIGEPIERDDAVDVHQEKWLSAHQLGRFVTVEMRHDADGGGTLLAPSRSSKGRCRNLTDVSAAPYPDRLG